MQADYVPTWRQHSGDEREGEGQLLYPEALSPLGILIFAQHPLVRFLSVLGEGELIALVDGFHVHLAHADAVFHHRHGCQQFAELYLRPTFDFKQELLAQGKEVEVLKPASLREDMKQMVMEMMEKYKD